MKLLGVMTIKSYRETLFLFTFHLLNRLFQVLSGCGVGTWMSLCFRRESFHFKRLENNGKILFRDFSPGKISCGINQISIKGFRAWTDFRRYCWQNLCVQSCSKSLLNKQQSANSGFVKKPNIFGIFFFHPFFKILTNTAPRT